METQNDFDGLDERIADQVVNYLKKNEASECKQFLDDIDGFFEGISERMPTNEKHIHLLKFVAEKSFNSGYRRGVVTFMNVLEAYREAKEDALKAIEKVL